MAKVKHTKTALKAQRDALRRYRRYLPTLQLKKQQIQLEVRRVESSIEAKNADQERLLGELKAWIRLFSEPFNRPWEAPFDFAQHLSVREVRMSEANIAGITVPVFEEVVFETSVPDLFLTASWVDDGLGVLQELIRLRAALAVLGRQMELLREELRITTQRVNLFEKVKIPESLGNIRVIRIFLGDQQTAEVVRAKIAKGRSVEKVRAA